MAREHRSGGRGARDVGGAAVSAWPIAVAAFLLSCVVIALRLRFARGGLDLPTHRSLHDRPTPHGGGLGIVAALLATGVWLELPVALLLTVLGLGVLSLLDDLLHLPFWLRLIAHLAAGLGVCHLLALPAWLWPPAVLGVAWMTNLFNFMDGADGLAGSQGVTGFAAYAAGFALTGDDVLAAWCAAISAACAGFLFFNWPPARIFMGDAGSIPLGFLAGGLGAWGAWAGNWPPWFPLLAFAPFVLDASVTLARRAVNGQRVWEAHRDHYYQRMVQLGFGHRGTTLRWGGVMLVGATLAVGLLAAPGWLQGAGVVAWLSILAGLGGLIDRRWHMR